MDLNVTPLRGRNVLGTALHSCCFEPKTGFYRDGFCRTDKQDQGSHTVCAIITQEFLDFSRSRGNDLVTAHLESGFPGLKPGDKWCLCAARWREALVAGVAPPVVLEATHERALETIALAELSANALH
jgi:uncharacterized protein (DUF2237 family)